MKFTTTTNKTYRRSLGYVPKPWIEYEGLDHKQSISKFFNSNIRVWDWDEGFDEEHDFVFDDGSAYRLTYSGWAEWHHDDEEENGLKQEWFIEKIGIDEANVLDKKAGRDWI